MKSKKDDYENCHCKVDREITNANVCKRCGGTVGLPKDSKKIKKYIEEFLSEIWFDCQTIQVNLAQKEIFNALEKLNGNLVCEDCKAEYANIIRLWDIHKLRKYHLKE